MKQKHILKWLGIALGVYLLYAVLTAVFVPLPQKEAAGELWSQYEARLSEDASQEREEHRGHGQCAALALAAHRECGKGGHLLNL